MNVCRRKLANVSVQRIHRKNIETGIDLANLFLGRAGRLLLDDSLHLGAAGVLPQNPAVSSRIVQICAQQRHGCLLFEMNVAQVANRLGRNQGRVAREHDHVVISGNRILGNHEGMPGSALI